MTPEEKADAVGELLASVLERLNRQAAEQDAQAEDVA